MGVVKSTTPGADTSTMASPLAPTRPTPGRVVGGLAMLALAVLLCLVLIPWLGIVGAALAMAGANALRGLAMAAGAKAVHGIATPAFSLPSLGRGTA